MTTPSHRAAWWPAERNRILDRLTATPGADDIGWADVADFLEQIKALVNCIDDGTFDVDDLGDPDTVTGQVEELRATVDDLIHLLSPVLPRVLCPTTWVRGWRHE